MTFKKIKGYSQGLNSIQVVQENQVLITTEFKCMSDKICLISGKHESCEDIYFCFSEPVTSLYKGNVTYLQSSLNYATDSISFPTVVFLRGMFNFSCAKIRGGGGGRA